MKIFVLSTVYPSVYNSEAATPVVHYFTREWVKMGHEVHVFHESVKYPRPLYWFFRTFSKQLYSKLGHPVSTKIPAEYTEVNEGVFVNHLPMKKKYPAPRYSSSEVKKLYDKIEDYCKTHGMPDIILGHWDNPQMEILYRFKQNHPSVKTGIVFHSLAKRNLLKTYGQDFRKYVDSIDYVGFRNAPAREDFEKKYGTLKRTFIASSGISNEFKQSSCCKSFDSPVDKYIYVGALIERKHPLAVLQAVKKVHDCNYNITYIGSGAEQENIVSEHNSYNDNGSVTFTGRIPRNEIIGHLRNNDVFIMISDNETFGLVYLEAMAMGCITIASKNGGVDGIIKDGFNGFLCNAGDVNDLCRVLSHIQSLKKEELQLISSNAAKTALQYTDFGVAKQYIDNFISKGGEK